MKGELSPKAAERFGRNDFENLSVICFANATVSLRLGHGAGLTAHRAVIQHRAAASLPCTGEASRCGGNFFPSRGSHRDSPLLAEGAFLNCVALETSGRSTGLPRQRARLSRNGASH